MKAYALPEGRPTTLRCVRILLPEDRDYYALFWASFEHLCKWSSYERDTGHSAAEVAAIWRDSFDQSRENFDESEGCGLDDVRQKPGEPCTLQKLVDGDWVDWADMTLCRDALTVPPIYSEPVGGRTPEEATADDMLWFLKTVIESTITDIDGGATVPEAIAGTAEMVAGITGTPVTPGVSELVNAIAGHTQQQRADALADIDWREARDAMLCATAEYTIPEDWGNWLQNASDALVEWLNDSSNWLVNTLNTLGGELSSGGYNGWGNGGWGAGGGGSGFGFTGPTICPPTIYDFEYMGGYYKRHGSYTLICDRPAGSGQVGYDGVAFDIPAGEMIVACYSRMSLTPDFGGWAALWWYPDVNMPPGKTFIPGTFGPWQGTTSIIVGLRDNDYVGDGIFAAAGLTVPDTQVASLQAEPMTGPVAGWYSHALGGDAGYAQQAIYVDYIITKVG